MIVDKDTKIYVGGTLIKEVYQGENKIYDNIPYIKLNYLESDGVQYINTGIIPNSKIKINVKYQALPLSVQPSDYPELFGSLNDWWGPGFTYVHYRKASNSLDVVFSDDDLALARVVPFDNREHTLSIQYQQVIFDGVKYTNPYQLVATMKYPIYLFMGNVLGQPQSTLTGSCSKIYYFQIWNDNILVRDFIPVLDKQGIPCFYDKVTKTCFYNQGEGQFIYG